MRSVSWTPESGHTVVFDETGPYYLTSLESDLGATAETARAPRQDGQTTYHTALDARTINLEGGMWIFGDRLHPAKGEYDRARARLHEIFAPNRWGTLVYRREDGAVQVRCRPVATPTISQPVGTYSTIDVTFTADSPYWESGEEIVAAVGVIRRLWHFPWSPVHGPMGAFSPFALLDNPTSISIYPSVEVFSTGRYVTVSHLDSGAFVTIEHAIAQGQKLTIDMSDVSAMLWEKDADGVYREKEDVSQWMSLDSTPWHLRPGANRVTLQNDVPEDTPVAYLRYRVPSLGV